MEDDTNKTTREVRMKKTTLLFAFILALLVGCSSTEKIESSHEPALPVISDAPAVTLIESSPTPIAKEPVNITAPETSYKSESTDAGFISPMQSHTEEQASTQATSIVFLGQKITAPGSYPDVPDLYAPVLDDIYLYRAVIHRYSLLQNEEGMATTEISNEYQQVERELWRRGRLPDSGYVSDAVGYTLFDLDGDNCLELLILDSSRHSYSKQTPYICSIYAIRSGQLVCIDKGSFELEYDTILATDNMFYYCRGYIGSAYSSISAFLLEDGMLEFTVVFEANASLSFAAGDVPVPYWEKKENGKTIRITENEFDMLFEQYNAKEPMKLDIVLLYPDFVDSWPVYPPEKPLLTEPIACPKSYIGAPSVYKPILDDLYLFSERIRLGESFEYTWENAGELGFAEPPRDEIGYAIVDINNDGIFELLLGSTEGLSNAAPHSIFTLNNGKPVLLVSFWGRSRGVVAADGTIYNEGSGGAAYTYLSSYRLDKNADTLTKLSDIQSDYSLLVEKPFYFRIVNGRNQYITEKEFYGLMDIYENPSEKIKLTVIPIAE